MYILKNVGDRANINYKIYTCDKEEDLKDILNDKPAPGSKAFVLENSIEYTLNSKKEWKISSTPGGGEGGTSDHNLLLNRDMPNQHPMSAITGLDEALQGKQPKGEYATKTDVSNASTLVVTITANPLDRQSYVADVGAREILNAVGQGRTVEAHFEDTVEKSGDQIYEYLKFKDNSAYFRRFYLMPDKVTVRQIDIEVKLNKEVVFTDSKAEFATADEAQNLTHDKLDVKYERIDGKEISQLEARAILENPTEYEDKFIIFMANKVSPTKAVATGFVINDGEGNTYLSVTDNEGHYKRFNKDNFESFSPITKDLTKEVIDLDNLTIDVQGEPNFSASVRNPFNKPTGASEKGHIDVTAYDIATQIQVYTDMTNFNRWYRIVTGVDSRHSFSVWMAIDSYVPKPKYGNSIWIGDSMGQGTNNGDYSYIDVAADSGLFKSVKKYAVGGACAGPYEISEWAKGFSGWEQIEAHPEEIKKSDYLFFEFGGNDWKAVEHGNITVGKASDSAGANTICGWLKKCFNRIFELNPKIHITYIGMVYSEAMADILVANFVEFCHDIGQEINPIKYKQAWKDWTKECVQVMHDYGITVVYAYENNFNLNKETISSLLVDKVHPTTTGHKRIFETLMEFPTNMFEPKVVSIATITMTSSTTGTSSIDTKEMFENYKKGILTFLDIPAATAIIPVVAYTSEAGVSTMTVSHQGNGKFSILYITINGTTAKATFTPLN